MKISSIKKQVKNPERVSVFVDDKYSFSLSLDELLKYKLKKGDELESADVKKFKQISSDGKLRARALEWVLNRPRSQREFKDYMYRKKADSKLTDALIADFEDKGYLDEHKFAEWFADLQKRRFKSQRAIRSELFKKGINREVVNELLEDDQSETERLKELIKKKQKTSRYKNDPLKLAKYLTSQGFSYPLVKEQLELSKIED